MNIDQERKEIEEKAKSFKELADKYTLLYREYSSLAEKLKNTPEIKEEPKPENVQSTTKITSWYERSHECDYRGFGRNTCYICNPHLD